MAAERVETEVIEIELEGGYLMGIYTVTTVAVGDWIDLDGFETTKFANAYTTADGTDQEAYVAGTNTKVFFKAGTPGASTVLVFGTSRDSIGGAT